MIIVNQQFVCLGRSVLSMYKILTVCMSPNDLMEQSYFKYYEKYLNCEVFLYNLVDDVIHIMGERHYYIYQVDV